MDAKREPCAKSRKPVLSPLGGASYCRGRWQRGGGGGSLLAEVTEGNSGGRQMGEEVPPSANNSSWEGGTSEAAAYGTEVAVYGTSGRR
jgi:hypothetical protein